MTEPDKPFPVDEALKDIDWEKLGDRQLCDSCLGRLVANLGHGMTNEDRGRVTRPLLKLQESDQCWLCNGLLTEVDKFALLVFNALEEWECRTFLIGSRIADDMVAREESLWSDLGSLHAEPLKAEVNREVGKRVEAITGKIVDFERPEVVAIIETSFDFVDVQVNPLYIRGRYRKLTRGIPQTKWPCKRCQGKGCEHCNGKGKMYDISVEEIIASAVMEQSYGSGHAFHGLGREDIDAKMLGQGRPFAVEIINPKRRSIDLRAVSEKVKLSGKVEVGELFFSNRDEVVKLKSIVCDKTYRLLIRIATPVKEEKLKEGIASLLSLPVAQRTPIRVSHRRADKVRERRVKTIQVIRFDGPMLELVVKTEAGSYLKEMVHGDKGRTKPNLAEVLGAPCEVLELDVLEVHDGE